MGSRDVELLWLQSAMRRWSLRTLGDAALPSDALNDEVRLRDHLREFQRRHQLAATGELGADTIIHLNSFLNGGEIPVLAN